MVNRQIPHWPRAISKTIKYSVWAIRYKKTHLTNTGEIVDECTCYQLRCMLILRYKVHTWLVEMLWINFKLFRTEVWIFCLYSMPEKVKSHFSTSQIIAYRSIHRLKSSSSSKTGKYTQKTITPDKALIIDLSVSDNKNTMIDSRTTNSTYIDLIRSRRMSKPWAKCWVYIIR